MTAIEQQIDIAEANAILNETGRRNLLLLRDKMPELYAAFKNYQPQKFHLCVDDANAINISDTEGNLVYPPDPRPEVMKQVDLYKTQAKAFVYRPEVAAQKKLEHAREQFIHAHHMDDVWRMRYQNRDVAKIGSTIPSVAPILAVVGLGLGYHLEDIVRTENFRHVFVYEPDMDIFYAFLHVIDLAPLFEKQVQGHGTLTFLVGSSSGTFINTLSEFAWTRGHFNISRLYYYCHYRSEIATEATKKMHELINRMMQGWGFFEDEIVGIAHSLLNAEERYPFIKNKTAIENPNLTVPAVIIGNGPSLDQGIETVKKIKDQCIIFSCGTALSSLHKHGIVPDFHVEIERTFNVDPWIEIINDPDYLNKITLITLNTVHPKVQKRFKNNLQALKGNDVGADLMWQALQDKDVLKANHCNPTVVNGGVSFSIALGFSTLYLFGVDFGFKDELYHHSKGSQYYNKDNPRAKLVKGRGDKEYPGNFSETILSNDLFDYGRFEVEKALRENRDVTCYNCSDGIRITYTTPLQPHKVRIDATNTEKQEQLKLIDSEHRVIPDENWPARTKECYQEKSAKIRMLMNEFIDLLEHPINSVEDILDVFSEQRALLEALRARNDIIFTMCSGTLNYFQTQITSYTLDHANTEDAMDFLKEAIPFFKYHLKCLLELEKQVYKTAHRDYCALDIIENSGITV